VKPRNKEAQKVQKDKKAQAKEPVAKNTKTKK